MLSLCLGLVSVQMALTASSDDYSVFFFLLLALDDMSPERAVTGLSPGRVGPKLTNYD